MSICKWATWAIAKNWTRIHFLLLKAIKTKVGRWWRRIYFSKFISFVSLSCLFCEGFFVCLSCIWMCIQPDYAARLYTTRLYTARLYAARLYTTRLYTARLYTTRVYTARLYTTRLYTTRLYTARLYAARLYKTRLYSQTVDNQTRREGKIWKSSSWTKA
jgi:hypothetical protein